MGVPTKGRGTAFTLRSAVLEARSLGPSAGTVLAAASVAEA
ncbi:hypothetical protein ABZ027_04100 [Streptomyces sp. NPDC006332]